MKYFFFWLILSPFAVLSQQRDSLLQVIEVYGIPSERFLVGSQVNEIDSALTITDRTASLSDILARQFPVYFRNYGNGMISGISLRGTAPQHTSVLWNGININSFSLGQADFSILPSNAFSSIKLHEGGGSARFGSGSFGGSVLLGSVQDVDENKLEIIQQLGSFSTFSTSVSNEMRLKKWSVGTRLYNLQSRNDFPVESLGRQQHASYEQRGLLQDVTWHLSGAENLQLNYWFHQAWREIQPTIGQTQSEDVQEDKNQRLCISYRKTSDAGYFNSSIGYVKDLLVFNGNESAISRYIIKGGHQYAISQKIQTEFNTELNYIDADIEEYNGDAREYRFDVFGGVIVRATSRLNLALNIRQPFVSGFSAPLLPYVGADYKIMEGAQKLSWTVNVSRNYRIPTFNDRYWSGAGSKDLLPENSFSAETSLVWERGGLRVQPLLYAQTIDQWIQWIPGDHGNYEPRNVKKVAIRGAQLRGTYAKSIGGTRLAANAHFQYSESLVKEAPDNEQYSVGKQLIYTPVHTAVFSMHVQRKQTTLLVTSQYNGQRFIDPANTTLYALDGYQLLNLSLSHGWMIRRQKLHVALNADNLLDQRYQMYAGRAMPGRNYNIQITYQLNYNQNETF